MSAGELRRRIVALERRLDEIEAVAKAKATQPPDDHAELVKDARKLVDYLTVEGFPVWAVTMRKLADLVEAYARSQPELVAACKTCEGVIGRLLCDYDKYHVINEARWPAVRNAHYLTHKAVENAPKTRADETVAVAVAEYGPLLEKLGDTTNQAKTADDDFMDADEFERRMEQSHPVPPPIDKSTTIAKIIETLREGRAVLPTVYQWRDVEKDLTDLVKEQPAPAPIEVEMRVTQVSAGGWTWECRWGGIWLAPANDPAIHCTTTNGFAKSAANHWLAALSAKLGVKLVAEWEGQQTTLKVETCEVCHTEYECDKPRVPYVCADCTEQYGGRVANPKDGE